MATSSSTNFNLTRNDIITEALELAGVKDIGESPTAAELTSCARTLNILIKGWQMEGVYLWKSKDFYAIPQYDTSYISLGPSDHATLLLTTTNTSAAAAAADLTIDVDDDTGISSGDYLGVELDDGTLQWTTVDGAPSSDTITLSDALTDTVSDGAVVYAYTTKIHRPLWVMEQGRVYDTTSGIETPFTIEGRDHYNRISIKTTKGLPNSGFYDPQLTDGKLYIWPRSNDVSKYLILTGRFPIEDFDSATDDADFPQEWYLALTWNLACAIAPKFLHRSLDPIMETKAAAYLSAVATFDKDYSSFIIEME